MVIPVYAAFTLCKTPPERKTLHPFRENHFKLMATLERFTLTVADITAPGGNESTIPKKIADAHVGKLH